MDVTICIPIGRSLTLSSPYLQHPPSSTSSGKSFTKKRGEGKVERRDSKSSSSSSQNANNALPLPSRSYPSQGGSKNQ